MTTEPGPITEQIPTVGESTPITEQVPTVKRAQRAPQQRRRGHPAAASRILAAGLATASTLGLVAVVGSGAHAADVQDAEVVETSTTLAAAAVVPTTAPPPVVVIRRTYVQVDGGSAPSTSSGRPAAASSPAAAPAPAQPSAPVTAPPRRSAPVTTSRAS